MPSPTTTYDWSSGSLPGAVTHGGGANGTKWNVSGTLVAGSSGRITFEPVSHACLGLLMEEARTNSAVLSQDLANAANWNFFNGSATSNSTTSPDGTADADTMNWLAQTAGIAEVFGNDIGIPVTTQMALSVFAKAGTSNPLAVCIVGGATTNQYVTGLWNSSTGAAGSVFVGSAASSAQSFKQQVGAGFWRFGLSAICVGGTSNWQSQFGNSDTITPSGANISGFGEVTFTAGAQTHILWQVQEEAGFFPSSPIITPSTSAVTRSADTATVASPSAGALKISGRTAIFIAAGQVQTIWSRDDGTAANTIKLIRNASNEIRFQVVTASVSQADILLGTVGHDTDFSVSVRWGTNDFAGSLNNAAVATDTSGTVPTTTTDRFGNSAVGADYWMATIARIDYYTTLTNNELQGIFLIPTFRRPVRVRRKARTIRQRRRFVPIAPQAPPVPISFAKPDDVLKRVRRKLPQQPRYVARAVARRHHLSPLLPTPYSISQPAKVQRRIRRKLARQSFSVARAVRERHNLAPIAPQGTPPTPTPFTRRVKFRIRKRTAARRRRFAPVAPQAVVPTPVSFSAAKRAINLRKRKVARQPNRALLRRHRLATVLPPFVPPVVPPLPAGGGGVTVGKPRRYPGVFADFSPKVNPKAFPKPVKSEPPLPGAMPVPIPEAYPKYLLGATPGDPRPRALQLIAAAKKKQQDEDDEDAFFILR